METLNSAIQSSELPVDPDWVVNLLEQFCRNDSDLYEVEPFLPLLEAGIDPSKVRKKVLQSLQNDYYGNELMIAVRTLWAYGFETNRISSLLSVAPETCRSVLHGSRWCPEERDAIAMHICGQTPVQIAKELEKTRGWVYYVFEIHGVTPRRHNASPPSKQQKREIIRRYDGGDSAVSIAKDLRLAEHQVYFVITQARTSGRRIRT